MRDVPAEATVVGVPARIITPKRSRIEASLDHADLPDPVVAMVRALAVQNELLRERVAALEIMLGAPRDDPSLDLPYEGQEFPRSDGG